MRVWAPSRRKKADAHMPATADGSRVRVIETGEEGSLRIVNFN